MYLYIHHQQYKVRDLPAFFLIIGTDNRHMLNEMPSNIKLSHIPKLTTPCSL